MKHLAASFAAMALLLAWCGPVWAKWYKLGTSKSGTWAVSDGSIKRDGQCKLFLAGLLYKRPKPTPHGNAAVKHWLVRACCRAETLQFLAYRYLNSQRRTIFKQKANNRPMKPRRGTIPGAIMRKACSPGFGMR